MMRHQPLTEYCTLQAALESQPRGTISRVRLLIEEDEATVFLIKGKLAGPRVWVQASLHGDEYDGILACLHLIEQYPAESWNGDIFICPIVNPTAFLAGTNASPKDHINMNRVFHPEPSGDSYSYQYGKQLFEEISSVADFFIDLHGGGKYLDVCPFAMVAANQPSAHERALQALKQVQITGIYERADEKSGLLIHALAAQGIPAVLLESGSGQFALDQTVNQHVDGVLAILSQLGMVDAKVKPRFSDPYRFQRVIESKFEVDGIQRYNIPVGTRVERGDVLLEVTTYPGYTKHQVICQMDQGIVLSIHTASLVRKNDYAVMIGMI